MTSSSFHPEWTDAEADQFTEWVNKNTTHNIIGRVPKGGFQGGFVFHVAIDDEAKPTIHTLIEKFDRTRKL